MLEIRTFGGLNITSAGQPIPGFATRKVEALLVYLAGAGQPCPRDQLAELLWDERTESQARSNLRVAISRLNQHLPGVLEITRPAISLAPGAVWLDAAALEAGLTPLFKPTPLPAAERAAAETALALYRGDFLAGYALRESRGFDDWLLLERERLRQRVMEALDRLVASCVIQKEWAAGLAHARRLLALDDLREESHRHVMRLLALAGEPAAALAQFETCSQALERELGVTASAATLALRQQIQAGALTASAPAPEVGRRRVPLINPLPQEVGGRYVGNAQRLAEVVSALKGDARLISLIGRGGIGKTALACQALSELLEAGAGSVAGVVALSALSTGLSLARVLADASRLLDEKAGSLVDAVAREAQAPAAQKIGVLLEQLRGRRWVLLLDNLETLQDPATGEVNDPDLRAFIEASLAQSAAVCLLVTSREPLPLPRALKTWERQIPLEAGLPEEEAVTLLRRFDVGGAAGLRDAPEDLLRQLARAVHGFPRALEAAAGLLLESPLLRPADLVHDRALLEGEVTITVVQQAIDRLPPGRARILEALALFNRPVPPAALEYLLAADSVITDLRPSINRLVRAHFITLNQASQHLTLHPIDQHYSYSRLPDTDDARYSRRAWHRRAANYFVGQRRPEAEWSTVADLTPQLEEFGHRLAAGDIDAAAQILLSVDRDHLWEWGERRRLRELYAALTAAGGPADPQLARACRRRQAWMLWPDMQTMVPAVEANLAEARAAGDVQAEADALDDLAQTHRFRADMAQGLALHEQALALYRQIGDRRGEGEALGGAGACRMWFRQMEAGLDYLTQALAIHRALNHLPSAGFALWFIGGHYRLLGQFERAAACLEEAIRTYGEINGQLGLARTLGDLASVHAELGQYAQAEAEIRKSLALARALNVPDGSHAGLAVLGQVQLLSGQTEAALETLRRAQAQAAEAGAVLTAAVAGTFLCQALIVHGDLAEAQRIDERLPALPFAMIYAFSGLAWRGVLRARLGQAEAARAIFTTLIREVEAWVNQPGGFTMRYARALAQAGLALLDDAGLAAAVADYQQALAECAAPGVVRSNQLALDALMQCPGGERLAPAWAALSGGQSR